MTRHGLEALCLCLQAGCAAAAGARYLPSPLHKQQQVRQGEEAGGVKPPGLRTRNNAAAAGPSFSTEGLQAKPNATNTPKEARTAAAPFTKATTRSPTLLPMQLPRHKVSSTIPTQRRPKQRKGAFKCTNVVSTRLGGAMARRRPKPLGLQSHAHPQQGQQPLFPAATST